MFVGFFYSEVLRTIKAMWQIREIKFSDAGRAGAGGGRLVGLQQLPNLGLSKYTRNWLPCRALVYPQSWTRESSDVSGVRRLCLSPAFLAWIMLTVSLIPGQVQACKRRMKEWKDGSWTNRTLGFPGRPSSNLNTRRRVPDRAAECGVRGLTVWAPLPLTRTSGLERASGKLIWCH